MHDVLLWEHEKLMRRRNLLKRKLAGFVVE